MSTSAFLPNATSSFASSPADFPHHRVSYSSFSDTSQPSTSTSQSAYPTHAATTTTTTRSPHSSSSSVSSRTDSSSPSMNSGSSLFEDGNSRGRSRRLTNSSRGGGPRSADGSVGSLATTISTGSPAIDPKQLGAGEAATGHGDEDMKDEDAPLRMKEPRRRRSGSGAMDISTLSVREEDDEDDPPRHQESSGGEGGKSSGPGAESSGSSEHLGAEETSGSKTRRASVLSSSSSIVRTTEISEGQESGRNGRRKAPRMGSFQGGDGAEASSSNSTPAAAPAAEATSRRPSPHQSPKPSVQPNTAPSTHHVDIVSYPSPELLRLLASLLEQIAQANDARNARAAASSSTSPSKPAGETSAAPSPSAGPSSRRSSLGSQAHVQPMSSARSDGGDSEADWSKGRFDAAPLNTPVTPRYKRRLGGEGGPGILDNALEGELDEEELAEREAEMPLTPGVDLLRETGPGGGVEGFMPSLGGTHAPQPLSRRRGSSFIRNKQRNEDGSTPSFSRRSSAAHASSASSAPSPSPQTTSSTTVRPPPATTAPSPVSSSGPASNEQPLSSLLTASAVALSSPNATLCFHARNVPAISIEAYLQRILKYCPTTNEVFLALLVYFDRMARIGLEAQRLGLPKDQQSGADASADVPNPHKLFAIDSYNVHRLVIAGVTVASKFFSDVFYTNSRYAKVGGLPLHELNQLELQFLLLNDFRLKISVDELQRYADQLILYWVGRNGDSNPTAAASAASFASSGQPRAHPGPPPGPPSTAIETPPLTRSAVAAAAAQAQAASSASAPQSSTSSSYSAHLAHSSTTSGGIDTTSAPTSKPFATGSGPTPASTSSATYRPSPHRPRSIRSHPSTSSSFSSSTVTPGTPSTTRTLGSSGASSDEDDDGPVGTGFRSRRQSGSMSAMDED